MIKLKNEKKSNRTQWRPYTLSLILTTAFNFHFSTLQAETSSIEEDANESSEVLLIIGSRNQKVRTVADSPVPVDVLSADDLETIGATADLTDNLKAMIPSYTATPATGDGSAFVRPTSLRGTAPDQTLILVNGKRRHRSALVQFFAPAAGNGAHGVDIGMIPAIALKRVEVLRDGASSQYGSDAIAGVINFVTKDSSDEGLAQIRYGQFFEGEQNVKLGFNQGLAMTQNGFINLSLEYTDNEALSRGFQRADAQALIESGVNGVGQDTPFEDAPLVQTWGRPESSGLRFFANAGLNLTNGNTLYSHLAYATTDGRYRFFYRDPNHSSTLAILRAEHGYTGLNAGFTPYLDGEQKDLSFVTGYKGNFSGETFFDFSVSYGENKLDYFLNNTVNAALGLSNGDIPKMDFDVGGYQQKEINLNADFSTPLSDSLNLAYGTEWREETYTAVAGEPDSYFVDNQQRGGASGLKGIMPEDAGSFSRDNYAFYVDMEQDFSSDFMMQYALRYENFSDFGSTINGKVAGRYYINTEVAIRGAISTGFHAPTPGQANVQTTITTFDTASGGQKEESLIPSTDPRVAAAGGKELTEEKSQNISFGVTADLGDKSNLTVDFYQINVDDRIYRTGDIELPGSIDTVAFYTNAMDVEHQGVDLVLSSVLDWSTAIHSDISLAYNYNKIEVVNQQFINNVKPVSDANVEDIENNYPASRFILTANTYFNDDINLMLRANYYGAHYDERGRINGVDGNPPTAKIGAIIYLDAELGYSINEETRLALGFTNLLDQYVDEIDESYANRRSVGLQYPRRSAANYEGGSWYLSVSYSY